MTRRNEARPGRFLTFRLYEPERQLLQDLGRLRPGVEDRHTALLQLVGIVDELDLEDVRGRKRRPLRVRIPEELEQAINRRVKQTGQTFLGVLMTAVQEYHHRYSPERRRKK